MDSEKTSKRKKRKVNSQEQLEKPSDHKPSFREKIANIKIVKWFWKKSINTKIGIITVFLTIIATGVAIIPLCQKSADNRAYISVADPFFNHPYILAGEAGWKLEATFSIVNNGETPAYEVRDSSHVEMLPKNTKLVMPNNVDKSKQFVCSPDTRQERETQSIDDLSAQQIAGFQSKDLRIFLWGIITYKDIAGKYHRTEFCYEYDIDQQVFRPYNDCNRAD